MKSSRKIIYTLLLSASAVSAAAADSLQMISEEYESLMSKPFVLLPHLDNYIIPVSYNNTPNEEVYDFLNQQGEYGDRGVYNRKTELEFQISFSVVIAKNIFSSDTDLLGAYTQQSWWQVYNSGWSRQFRESNYNPELFARHVLDPPFRFFGSSMVLLDYGYMHESNGQVQELSRSWDRIFVRSLLSYGNIVVIPSVWYRIPVGESEDFNPDIEDYLGYGELVISNLSDRHNVRMKLIPGIRKQGVELAYSYPMTRYMRYYVKINYGYGHSLIDYDHKTERIGVGVVLTNWLTL